MDKTQALRILDLDENASRKQIEDRFSNLSRRVKNGENLDFESIKKAYDMLMGYERPEDNAGKLALFYRKFMFHYKGWVILIAFALIIIGMVFIPIAFRRVPDLTVSFAGRFGTIDQEYMDSVLQEGMPDTEDILVEIIYLDDEGESAEFDSGGRTRLSGLLISEEADILIVDDATFNYIRSDNSLMALDEVIKELVADIPEEDFIYGIDFESGEKKIYGILIEDNHLADKTVYGEDKQIITIALRTGHVEDSARAIDIILTYGSE